MRSGNPALNAKTFAGLSAADDDRMTLMGTVHKTFALLVMLVVSAALTWGKVMAGNPNLLPWIIGGVIGGVID